MDWDTWDSPLITLGEVAAGESQELKLGISYRDEGAARIYFTATAWNARPTSTSLLIRDSETRETAPAPAERAANADFASALALTESPQKLDLLLAATEAGEPASQPRNEQPRRPANSVWYEWTAPVDGSYLFDLRADSEDGGSGIGDFRIEFFQGDSLSSIKRAVPGSSAAVEFFSRASEVYKIRISHFGGSMPPAALHWSQNAPANDLFSRSAPLEAAEGSVQGSNQGATLEASELFGNLAATVWYRWTAPDDGYWRFESGNFDLRTLVFVGSQPSQLRLVSGQPHSSAAFPARRGQEYRIAVASKDAYGGGGSYILSWNRAEPEPGNDDFHNAEDIGAARSSSQHLETSISSTVEPGEPAATGVRTEWLRWTAPEDGFYTWRLFDPDRDSPASLNFTVAAFSGASLANLELVGATNPHDTSSEFVFHAVKGRRYSISIGYQNNAHAAFDSWSDDRSVLHWGPTPANDNLNRAAVLTGGSGVISGSNEFATIEPGERGGSRGAASLWYDYEAPASGWTRFSVDSGDSESTFPLTVYRRSGSGLIQISKGPFPDSEVVFEAEAGVHYLIRLGSLGNAAGGDFTLGWEESALPAWLKYLGALKDGGRDGNGRRIQLDIPWRTSLAFDSGGAALFLAAEAGLQVFERDPESGELRFVQLLEIDQGAGFGSSLLWDSRRNRLLYAAYCGRVWRQFAAVDGGRQRLENGAQLPVSGEPEFSCGLDAVLMDATGSFVYAVYPGDGLEVYALTAGGLEYVQTAPLDGIRRALVANSNSHVFALTENSLQVYARDPETGKLTPTRKTSVAAAASMAISHNDQYLFAAGPGGLGPHASVFRLGPDADPELLAELDQVPPSLRWGWFTCRFAAPRKGLAAVDVFCEEFAVSLQWRPDIGRLVLTDYLALDEFDRFDNFVHDFGQIEGGAASPDGRHAYMATDDQALMIVERVNNAEGHRSATPVLASRAGILRLPMIEYREEAATLCFAAEFHRTMDSGNWLDSGGWTLNDAAGIQCGAASGLIPFLEAGTWTLRIPYGKILDEGELTCFTAELQAGEEYRNWTLLAGAALDCR